MTFNPLILLALTPVAVPTFVWGCFQHCGYNPLSLDVLEKIMPVV